MKEKIEMATISSRGQICIPNDIREEMGLEEGNKVLFVLTDNSLIMKKADMQTFRQITAPLKEEAKKIGMKEADANEIVHRARKNDALRDKRAQR